MSTRFLGVISFASIALLVPIFVYASSPVYDGCALPSATFKHIYYADPVNGSMSNDGSEARPWGSLSSVLAAGKLPPSKSAVVQSGDAVYLMSGNHGANINIGGSHNSDFITIANAPGQTPKLGNVIVRGGSKWVFQGLAIEQLNNGTVGAPGYTMGIRVYGDSAGNAPSNMIFNGNTIYSQPEVSGWSQQDWKNLALASAINQGWGGNCIAITNNTIKNVKGGIGVTGSHILVQGNTINNFGADGIDVTGSNTTLQNNIITNSFDLGDSNHLDGIQGWTVGGVTNTNLQVKGNVIIAKTGTSNISLPEGGLQGISIFDGAWKNVEVTNNVIVPHIWHGLSMYGIDTYLAKNNIVVADEYATFQTWLGVFKSKTGVVPVNNVITENLASKYSGVLASPGVTESGNQLITNHSNVYQKIVNAYNAGQATFDYYTFLSQTEADQQAYGTSLSEALQSQTATQVTPTTLVSPTTPVTPTTANTATPSPSPTVTTPVTPSNTPVYSGTPTVSLLASATSLTQGQTIMLTWSVTNASSCSADGFPVSGFSGAVPVSPFMSTTYAITCVGGGGSATQSVAITVNKPTISIAAPRTTKLTVEQIASVMTMLTSFGAQASTLAEVRALLDGAAPVASSLYTRDLTGGSVGSDVRALQQYLNTHGFIVAISGPGSAGKETSFFGQATKAALIRFQKAHGVVPALGYFGAKTRAVVNAGM